MTSDNSSGVSLVEPGVGLQAAIERLERSTWDSRVPPLKADVRLVLDALGSDFEVLAEGYKALSGKRWHMSDCATSCAPAYKPGPCDCCSPHDEAAAVLKAFNGGLVNVPDASNPRGYTTYYRPLQAMRTALGSAKR